MKEFKDAEIGSQWELNGRRRAIVVDVDNGSTLAKKLLWIEHETSTFWFNDNGVQTSNKRSKVVGPWREKLKWEGEVILRDNIDSVYADNVELKDNLMRFIGKKTRMTLEEL